MSGEGHQGPRTAERDTPPPRQPDAEAIRAALARLFAAPEFGASDGNRRFLSHVVTETLEGRGDRINAHTIATEVFGRDAGFDPKADPIVQVEAAQLRRALDRYYLSVGRRDPVEISIPKGGFAPVFDLRLPPQQIRGPDPAPPAGPKRRSFVLAGIALAVTLAAGLALAFWSGRALPGRPGTPVLLVQPFEDLTRSGNSALLATGLTQEVIGRIEQVRDIVVIAADADGRPLSEAVGVPTAGDQPRYLLSGSLDLDGGMMRMQAQLVSRSDGAMLWADSFAEDLSALRLTAIEEEIAAEVATALARAYGTIQKPAPARPAIGAPEDWAARACMLTYYSYRLTLDPQTHAEVLTCLEAAVARHPDHATAWGLLSQTYIDQMRLGLGPEPVDGPALVQRALTAARKAIAIDPTNVRALQAAMFALYFSDEKDAAIQVGKTALDLNPGDTELMGELGFRIALFGDWQKGCALLARARARNPGPPGYYETAFSLCAYEESDYATAATWIRRHPMADNPQYHAVAAVIFAELGDPQAAAEVDWLRRNAPQYLSDPRGEVTYRVGRRTDVEQLLASLEKAGIPVDDD